MTSASFPQRKGPSGPRTTTGGLVQSGYDQVLETVDLPSAGSIVPRNVAGDPLQVALPGVTPGNVLEVEYRVGLVGNDEGTTAFRLEVVVSFDGSTSYPTSFFFVNDTQSGVVNVGAGIYLMSQIAAVVVPPGATTATVQLSYVAGNDGGTIAGLDRLGTQGSSGTLKAAEYTASVVTQPGPSTLVAAP